MVIFLSICLGLALVFFSDAIVVWFICQLLPAIGLTMIGNWHVEFSWTLVLVVVLLQLLFNGVGSSRKKD